MLDRLYAFVFFDESSFDGETAQVAADQFAEESVEVLLVANDQSIKVTSVTNESTGTFINDATVTATLKTSNRIEVEGQSWPLTLNYEVNSDGNYSGLVSKDVALIHNKQYIVEISVDGGDGLFGFWSFIVRAKYRTP